MSALTRGGIPGWMLMLTLLAAWVPALGAERPAVSDAGPGVVELRELFERHVAWVNAAGEELRPNRRSWMARLDALREELERLRDTRAFPALRAAFLQRLEQLARDIGTARAVRQDEFGIRIEEDMGIPLRHPNDVTSDDSAWLSTVASQFVTIQKTVYLGAKGSGRALDIVNGTRMAGSFVAEGPATQVGILFSAEAALGRTGGRMFVRALIDGAPANPGNVVFASGEHQGVRSFIFTAQVDAGIHTVEMQWMVDRGSTGYLRTASMLIRSGRSLASALGSMTVVTPPSGGNIEQAVAAWQNVPGASGWVYVPVHGVLTASFSAESAVSAGKALAVRALVDGAPGLPGDVIFARGGAAQSRTATFTAAGVAAGWHHVRIQSLAEAGGTATIGDRSLLLAGYPTTPAQPTHPVVVAPSGANVLTVGDDFQPVPNLGTYVWVGPKGNGEIAVQFSGEIVATHPAMLKLVLDGVAKEESVVEVTDGTVAGQVKTYVFAVKQVPAGMHRVEVWWAPAPGSVAQMGDRILSVMSETGLIPDLAEPRMFGVGTREKGDNIFGLEPSIGVRDVLLILWDPKRPGHPTGLNSPPGPDYKLPPQFTEAITRQQVEQLFFGANNSVNEYYRAASGGKFGIRNAGVVGWYDALKEPGHYWDTHPDCDSSDDGFESENAERWAEAVALSNPDVDFSKFDRDGDGRVEPHELAVVVVAPQATRFGTAHQLIYRRECPSKEPLILDGVQVVEVLELFLSFKNPETGVDDPVDTLNVAAHETLHQLTGIDDMYSPVPRAVGAGRFSIMATRDAVPFPDPIHRLAFGWVTPRTIDANGFYEVKDVKTDRRVYVLPRYNNQPYPEYYVIENRQDNPALGPLYDTLLNESGIAVWHAVEDTVQSAHRPRGVSQEDWDGTTQSQARRGIRMVRPWRFLTDTGAVLNGIPRLWSSDDYTLKSEPCPAVVILPGVLTPSDNTLSWADCSASGYGVRFLSPPAPSMTIQVQLE